MIATPVSLIALLRFVAQGWHDAGLAENALEIRDAGMKLYDQLRVMAERLAVLGNRLKSTNDAYNSSVTVFDGHLWSRAKTLAKK